MRNWLWMIPFWVALSGSKPFLEAITSYKSSFSQYLGNTIGAFIVIGLAAVVVFFMGQIQKWLKKSKRP